LAAIALAAFAGPAFAQGDAMRGTYAFQTDTYGNEQFSVSMSGAANVTESRGRLTIRLTANEMIVERASKRSQIITAHQNCTGERDGAQISIQCEMAEPLEGYTPDAFVLQPGQNGQWAGVINGDTQVMFAPVRN
jgi:hypothetical protein